MSGVDLKDLESGAADPTAAVSEPVETPVGADLAESLGETANLDLLMDVDMKLTVELGRARRVRRSPRSHRRLAMARLAAWISSQVISPKSFWRKVSSGL